MSAADSLQSEEQRYISRRIRDNPMWTLDRGTGYHQQERLNKKKASLLGTGRNAGKSQVLYHGVEWTRILRHVWKRDFFTTAVHARFQIIMATMVVMNITLFTFWALIYFLIWQVDETCFLGFNSFLSAFLFSIETQNTIGYGSHAIGDCWLPAWLVAIQCISAVLLEAVFIGIVFAKISHPKGRSRTILISESACIARRDGILKFMFRVADIRKRTAIAPKIHAVLYTWGSGHTTAEGEHVPVQVQPLPLHYLDATLLLPVVVEHTIDERSPLYGHTSVSFEALAAEIVVTFEGQSELGDAFMTRQSYLPSEIHWGCAFVNIIERAKPGSMQHSIDLSRFHEIEPQLGLGLMPPHHVSRAVVCGGARRVPWPRLGENTLLLADELVLTQAPGGRWFVAVRIGDVYPSQMCSANVQMFIYRYSSYNSQADSSSTGCSSQQQQQAAYTHMQLPLTCFPWSNQNPQQQQQGLAAQSHVQANSDDQQSTAASQQRCPSAAAHVLLRYPVVLGHEIGADSPLKGWTTREGMLQDADAEIVVVASATMYITSHHAMRSKVYSVLASIRWGHSYTPCVVPPKRSPTGHAWVDWSVFHQTTASHPAAAASTGVAAGSSRRHACQQYKQHQQHGDGLYQSMDGQVGHSQGHSDWQGPTAVVLNDANMQGAWQQQRQHSADGLEDIRMSQNLQENATSSDGSSNNSKGGPIMVHTRPLGQQQQQQPQQLEHVGQQQQQRQQRTLGQDVSLQRQQQLVTALDSLYGAPGTKSKAEHSISVHNHRQQQQLQQPWQLRGVPAAGIPFDATAATSSSGQLQQSKAVDLPATSCVNLEQHYEETHTLTMLPPQANSWVDKRSLAAVMDLFAAAADAASPEIAPKEAG
eukprot:GHRR01009961.1.p1 GENE.GHRR01009961.1~~GHRR01009961.1.p1  ORF type:complete len:908 (+),score=299.94 GHRR01009961.1:108-2726(+)